MLRIRQESMEIPRTVEGRFRFVSLKDTRTMKIWEIGCTSLHLHPEPRVLIATCSTYVGAGMLYAMTPHFVKSQNIRRTGYARGMSILCREASRH